MFRFVFHTRGEWTVARSQDAPRTHATPEHAVTVLRGPASTGRAEVVYWVAWWQRAALHKVFLRPKKRNKLLDFI